MIDQASLLAILRIGHDTSCRGAGISLREAIKRTDYKRLRRHIVPDDLMPLIHDTPELITQWIMYCEDKRSSGGFWINGDSFKVGTVDSKDPVLQYSSVKEAVAEFVVKELDYWSVFTERFSDDGFSRVHIPQVDYRIRHNKSELESTGYMEIGPGKYTGSHWQDGFVFVRDDAFAVAEGIIEKHFPDYDHLEMNDIPRAVAVKMIADWRNIADRLPSLDRSDIEREMNLISSWFCGLEAEIDSHRDEVAAFLRSIATDCENFIRDSEWICILGM